MARAWPLLLIVLAGCLPPEPLGVYRVPMQTGPESLELRTLLARLEGDELVLRDARDDEELARAATQTSWVGEPMPYEFGEVMGYPLTLYVRDLVLEDVETRPWAVSPVAPVRDGVTALALATLSSAARETRLFSVDGLVFEDAALDQATLSAIPTPLEALSSISGAGLVLRPDAAEGAEWKDAISNAVVNDPKAKMPCGSPLKSLYRSTPDARVTVPAGTFDAVHVIEIVDSCQQAKVVAPRIFKVERWYAPGVGPVRMLLTPAKGGSIEYRLLSTTARAGGKSLWPLEKGLSWHWEVIDAQGNIVLANEEVRVKSALVREFPAE